MKLLCRRRRAMIFYGSYLPQNPVLYAQITASSLCRFQLFSPGLELNRYPLSAAVPFSQQRCPFKHDRCHLPKPARGERPAARTQTKGARQAALLNGAQILIFDEAAYRPDRGNGLYPFFILPFVFSKRLRSASFLPLRRENVLRDLFLVGFGQLQKPAPVFKPVIALVDDAHNLTEHSRFRPLLQQPDLQ